MLSGDTSLMKGNSDACAIVAANAVFPEPGGPKIAHNLSVKLCYASKGESYHVIGQRLMASLYLT